MGKSKTYAYLIFGVLVGFLVAKLGIQFFPPKLDPNSVESVSIEFYQQINTRQNQARSQAADPMQYAVLLKDAGSETGQLLRFRADAGSCTWFADAARVNIRGKTEITRDQFKKCPDGFRWSRKFLFNEDQTKFSIQSQSAVATLKRQNLAGEVPPPPPLTECPGDEDADFKVQANHETLNFERVNSLQIKSMVGTCVDPKITTGLHAVLDVLGGALKDSEDSKNSK